MKLFIDTADVAEIREAHSWGILDGVTTNPSLLAKESGDYRQNLKKICDIVKGPVSGEVTATDFAGMIAKLRTLPPASIVVCAQRLSPTGSTLSPSLRIWIMMRAFSSSWL